jgi:bla regulator protein blaR1
MTLTVIGNHLWQSTIFTVAAGLLSLALRKQGARVRYWVWLAASVKFLIPFSWLVAVGSHLAWSTGFGATSNHRLQVAIEVISGANSSALMPDLTRLFPLLVGVWFCGIVAVLSHWCVRWRRMSHIARAAVTLPAGRVVTSLAEAERMLGIRRPTPVLLSKAFVEPGVFGIACPVLVWPEGLSQRLSDAELEAILTHEVRHIQRRDNLTAAIHMLVEAIFWFHPLAWWLGTRLIEERELACDEGVLELGNQPRAYAEGILKVCEFCLMSPLPCMSGVASGDLKRRMVSIMTIRVRQELGFGRKVLLSALGLVTLAGPIAVGLVHASVAGIASTAGTSAMAPSEQASGHPSAQASKEEMAGLLVKKVQPSYPEGARKGHIQGAVILRATISKDGDVENLQVVSGPPELTPSAIEAVKQWKYRPYMKDGHAVEVETDITVNFSLSK